MTEGPGSKPPHLKRVEPCCSFCGRKKSETKAMFRSDNARICDRCVLKFKQDQNG